MNGMRKLKIVGSRPLDRQWPLLTFNEPKNGTLFLRLRSLDASNPYFRPYVGAR